MNKTKIVDTLKAQIAGMERNLEMFKKENAPGDITDVEYSNAFVDEMIAIYEKDIDNLKKLIKGNSDVVVPTK